MKRVLFVCIGNCCRSQMAEGFANVYGKDVLTAASAGLAPTPGVAPETVATMEGKNIDISHHYPKRFEPIEARDFDVIVNISGFQLPGKLEVPMREWNVEDPFGENEEAYLRSCNDIERRVMLLILEFRRNAEPSRDSGPPIASSRTRG